MNITVDHRAKKVVDLETPKELKECRPLANFYKLDGFWKCKWRFTTFQDTIYKALSIYYNGSEGGAD